MKKLKISALMAGAAMALGLAGSAQALTLTAGNYKITLDTYDSGTTYGNSPGFVCNSVAACDAAAVNKAPGSVTSSNPSADTMGIISVTAITNLATGVDEYIRGTASTIGGISLGPYLTGVFANLSDRTVETACGALTCTTTALAVGGGFKLWSNNTNYDPTQGPLTSDLNAYQYAPSVSNGTLFLEGVFAAGAAFFGDNEASYVTSYNSNTLKGEGSGFLNFTGGAGLPFFDTNSVDNANGGKSDAFLTTTFDNVNNVASNLGWTVKGVAQVSGELVPEPGSLALASLALLGLGAIRRRKSA